MDIFVSDILEMKKPHPCGEKRWLVLHVGQELRLRCMGCGHEVVNSRQKVERSIRRVLHTKGESRPE
ncbi:MAG: DUF951 domain-containing protein [Firmicutes bacterium]|nr:DUF951 domain-containing protein [Bacillota bacterium]